MMKTSSYWASVTANRVSRRRLLGGAAGLGAAATLAACGGGSGKSGDGGAVRSEDEGTPKPGGIMQTATITLSPHFSPYHRGADPSAHQTWRRTNGYYDKLWGLRNTTDPARLVYMNLASAIEQVDDVTVVAKMQRAFYQDQPQSKSNSKVNARQATAEDIAASWEFLKAGVTGDITASSITTGKDLKSVTAVDQLTVRYDMYRPLAFFY